MNKAFYLPSVRGVLAFLVKKPFSPMRNLDVVRSADSTAKGPFPHQEGEQTRGGDAPFTGTVLQRGGKGVDENAEVV